MSKLPDELIVEIISWLPVKSLLRFKSVSKTWQSLISHPKFAKLQLTRSKENHSHINHHRLLLTTCPPQSVDYEAFAARKLSFPAMAATAPQEYPCVQILGSCDGLVCLLEDLMFIWNPTTGDSRQLPNPNAAFYSVLLHGVGYNYFTDDYGVVFASRYTANGTKETMIELYTLKTGTWRRIQDTDLIPKSFELGSGISWNGDLYWLSIKESGVSRVYTVICFDMVEEKFKEILSLPDHMDPNIFNVNLGISGNCLCVFSECSESSFEGLILNINGNEVSYNRLFRYPHDSFAGYGNKALCLTKNGQVVMDSDGWEVYLYDPKQGKCYGSFWLRHDSEAESQLYQESLVSPNC